MKPGGADGGNSGVSDDLSEVSHNKVFGQGVGTKRLFEARCPYGGALCDLNGASSGGGCALSIIYCHCSCAATYMQMRMRRGRPLCTS
jgi:hypothetical protein